MGLEQVTGTTTQATPVDYDRYRLRRFVEELDHAEIERFKFELEMKRAHMSMLSRLKVM